MFEKREIERGWGENYTYKQLPTEQQQQTKYKARGFVSLFLGGEVFFVSFRFRWICEFFVCSTVERWPYTPIDWCVDTWLKTYSKGRWNIWKLTTSKWIYMCVCMENRGDNGFNLFNSADAIYAREYCNTILLYYFDSFRSNRSTNGQFDVQFTRSFFCQLFFITQLAQLLQCYNRIFDFKF